MISRHLTQNIILFFICILVLGCNSPKEDQILIAISKGKPAEHYGNYGKWLKIADPTIEWVDLYHISLDSALMTLDQCSGLLISGGPDVYPGRYGQADDTVRCGSIDYRRDTLEFILINKALAMGLPILGICRGEQIMNVVMGGSLYVDIPTDFDSVVLHRCKDEDSCFSSDKSKAIICFR